MTQLSALAERHEEGDETLTAQMMLDGFQAAAKEIRAKVPQAQVEHMASADEDLEYFLQTMEEFTVESIEAHPDILEESNAVLDRLYDWCDVNRWWIAPSA